jgi:hypothetical protein
VMAPQGTAIDGQRVNTVLAHVAEGHHLSCTPDVTAQSVLADCYVENFFGA